MHNINRTLSEYEPEYEAFEADTFEFEEQEEEGEAAVFSEAEEMERASELLSVSNEEELDPFRGKLIKKAAGAVRKAVKSPWAAPGGLLKGAVKKVPLAQRGRHALRWAIGTAVGGQLASAGPVMRWASARRHEPRRPEYEVACRLVRLSAKPRGRDQASASMDPAAAARNAVVAAARKHAPGLVRPATGSTAARAGSGHSGRWIRRGGKIILVGV
jgi:hypothetical protein